MENRLKEKVPLPDSQEEALQLVLSLAFELLKREESLQTPATKHRLSPMEMLSSICSFLPSEGLGLATAIRRGAGGEIQTFESGDQVRDDLLILARDYYPLFLLPQGEPDPFDVNPFPLSLLRLSLENPANQRFVKGIKDNEPLKNLFPPGPIDEQTATRSLMSGSGVGGMQNAGFLSSNFLRNAESRAKGFGSFSLEGYLQAVEAELEGARQLAEGKEVAVPVSVGLRGATLAEGLELKTPWGTLRQPNSWQQRWAPEQADVVLQTELSLVAVAPPEADDEEVDPKLFEGKQRLNEEVDLLRLGLLLGSTKQPPLGLAPSWWLISDPLNGNAFQWGLEQPRVMAGQLEERDVPLVQEWMMLVRERTDPKLDLATRRILSAVTKRLSAEDGFIDAMIALESIFGTGHGEIGFRLSLAMAWLLESDAATREKRRREVSSLYEQRSKLVHGGHLDPQKAEEARTAASELVIAGLKKLYKDRPDLIPDDHRGRTLAIGGSPDPSE